MPWAQSDYSAAAQRRIDYFAAVAAENSAEHWQLGLDTAREWLRLINASPLSAQQVASIVDRAQMNQRRGTGWSLMAFSIRWWASRRGFTVPSFEEFYRQADSMNGSA